MQVEPAPVEVLEGVAAKLRGIELPKPTLRSAFLRRVGATTVERLAVDHPQLASNRRVFQNDNDI